MNKLIQERVDLKNLTTFKVGGKARYFAQVKSDEEIIAAFNFAKENNLLVFILGGGSDILVSDIGFSGLVIKFVGDKIYFKESGIVSGEGGVSWDYFVGKTVEEDLQGLECLSGIPGTLGASPIQNIGAYGVELKDSFQSLRAYDSKENKFVNFDKEACKFGYRESIFKKEDFWQRYLITEVTFKLNKNKKPEIEYESLLGYLKENKLNNPSLKEIRDAVISIRHEKLENPKLIGNAGSFFKNPIVKKEELKKLIDRYPNIVSFPFGIDYKISAGWLIDKAGLKGKKYQNAAVSSKNALILVNLKNKATSEDVIKLSKIVIEKVFKKFGVTLEPEVQFIGFEKKVAILGYGLEGKDAEKFFKSLGMDAAILDKNLDPNYLNGLDKYNVIVRSPGVYRYLPEIVEAEKKRIEITSAIKIFFDKCPGKIIGVTGTKGKGTTSTLIYEILKGEGKDVHLAGNIGKPYLSLLSKLKKESVVILELSSFQLIDLTKSPDIAVILNITLDHMDWHKSKEEYVRAKENIVRFQKENDFAVVNYDYETPKKFGNLTKGKVLYFSKKGKIGGCFVDNNEIFLDVDGEKNLIGKTKDLQLRGEHNWENITAAICASSLAGASIESIKKTVFNFKGLEHRLEFVKSVNGVSFYNDSFATGPQPTIAAIKSFTEPETLILGGSDKGLNYDELGEVISKSKNINTIILIGQIANYIKESILKAGYKGKLINLGKENIQKIVETSFRETPKGGVVILSPAAASFDMFKNYKDRGDKFKEAVQKLK